MTKEKDQCDVRVIHEDRVARARQNVLDSEALGLISRIFKALGDPTRLKILWALDHGEMCVCDLAAMLDISESAVSQQLRTLRHLSLVNNRREGTILYYNLMDEHVRQLVNMALEHVRE